MNSTIKLFSLLACLLLLQGCASDKAVYRGETLNGYPHGTGKKYFPDGSKYEGQWANGQYSGQGVLTWADKIAHYEGEFANGQRDGQGKMYYSDGATYEGGWKADKRNGHGLFLQANGNRYDCDWQNDAAQGQGKQQFANGNYYLGNFSNGVRSGDGAAVAYYDPANTNWCIDNCSMISTQFAVVSGNFANGNPEMPSVTPCGADREKCKTMLAPAIAAIAKERARKLAEAEAERKRKADAAEAERKRKEAAILAEQQRKEAERLALLNTGSAAQVYTYADKLESDKDFVQASEVYRVVVNRFPDSPFAAAAMTRLGVMRDKRDQQEAEAKRAAQDAENRQREEQRRQQEATQRQAERDAEAKQRQADRDAMAAQQQRSTTGAACIEAAKAVCDQQFSGFANIACKAAAGAGCN